MNQQNFKVGDRLLCTHPLTNREVEITEYPHIDNQGEDWNWAMINGNQLMHTKYLSDKWNPEHFGETPRQVEANGQGTIFFDDSNEPPEPDDFKTIEEFNKAWKKWHKPKLPKDAPIAVILFSGGGGVEAGMVEAGIRPSVAVEFDPGKPKLSEAIADSHDYNFSEYGCRLIRQPVQKVADLGFPGFPKNPDFLHASPVCSNFSNAKAKEAIETLEDTDMACAIANAIHHLRPRSFTLENVRRYQESNSFKIIVRILEECGYVWQGEVVTLLGCQARERFIVTATKEWLPPLLPPIKPMGWYEVISDLIPQMKDSKLVSGQRESLEAYLADNEPTPLLIQRTGAREEYKIKPAHLPINTILRSQFTDGKGANRNKFADIWLPDGTVKSVSVEAMARLQGFPDWYEFPPDTATAGSIIGYSVPPEFAARLFKSLLQPPPIEVQIQLAQKSIIEHNWQIQNLEAEKQTKAVKDAIKGAKGAIASEQQRIDKLLEGLIVYRQFKNLVGENEAKKMTIRLIMNYEDED